VTNAMRAADQDEPPPLDSDHDRDDLRAENQRLRSGLEQMRDEVLRLGRALEALHRLHEQVAVLNAEAERLRAVAGELREASERSRAETAAESRAETAAERSRADQLTSELAAAHASTSWRLTRPVRWLARLLRGSG
jgi:hypothetical protein